MLGGWIKNDWTFGFYLVIFFTATSVFIVDQSLKYKTYQLGRFYICNKGVSFGLVVPNLLFWSFFIIILSFGLFFLHKLLNKEIITHPFLFGAGLFYGGALSNGFDRLFRGCVIDYIQPPFSFFPFFNIADLAIFISTLILTYLFYKKSHSCSA